jgi:hypothetical protein
MTDIQPIRKTAQPSPPLKANGAPPLPSLTTEGAKAVEAGLAQHLFVAAERDQALKDLAAAREENTRKEVEIEALRSFVTMLESRMQSSRLECERAVAERATWEALFVSIASLLRTFNVPAAPLIKPLTTDECLTPATE